MKYNNFETQLCLDEMDRQNTTLTNSLTERDRLEARSHLKLKPNYLLTRAIVSYQANKKLPLYRWYKYKEGFSASMVEYFHRHSNLLNGNSFLDPFAGSGVALFVMQEKRWRTTGIELLPIGNAIIEARSAAKRVSLLDLRIAVKEIYKTDFSDCYSSSTSLNEINITRDAYPADNKREIDGYLSFLENRDYPNDIKTILNFAALCVLESISYTRKDGQYLRWDHRSPRSNNGTSFNKGSISSFKDSLRSKLSEIIEDISAIQIHKDEVLEQDFKLIKGSVLDEIHKLPDKSIDLVITSPPYLNRYDYTRTYALELAFLGVDDDCIKKLRQDMLSCTVENKEKEKQLQDLYVFYEKVDEYEKIVRSFNNQFALRDIIVRLEELRGHGKLNNPNIVRMVRNYFYEMSFVIFELGRLLRDGGKVYMVNDNVRYGGEVIPVDLILSDIAESAGFETEVIWTLARGKGNSSQQMGKHGHQEIRKSTYVWKRKKRKTNPLYRFR